MPANVTPEYQKAEERYRRAADDAERLVALQEMLSAIPKHKGTEKMQGDIKRRISQLRKSQRQAGKSKGPDPFHVPKSGAGQAVLVGTPNTGKSSLVQATTNADVKVADYPHTTVLPLPGMWEKDNVQIELVDTPPLTADHVPPGLLGTIRAGDIACLVADAAGDPLEQIESVLDILTDRGLTLRSVPVTALDPSDPGQHVALIVATKTDAAPAESVTALSGLYDGRLDVRAVSALTGEGLDELFARLWELLAVMRVYSKQPGKAPDLNQPFTVPVGSTLEDLAREIHRELPEKMKHARIWGEGRHAGQHVHRTEVLKDGDIVEIHE